MSRDEDDLFWNIMKVLLSIVFFIVMTVAIINNSKCDSEDTGHVRMRGGRSIGTLEVCHDEKWVPAKVLPANGPSRE